MRYILIALMALSLSGCLTTCTKIEYVNVPVWTPPVIKPVTRPVLKSNTATEDLDLSSKTIQTDMNDLSTYATQLEQIITAVKSHQPASAVAATK